jgi:uncharacterized protein (TIGR02453 family)
MIGRQLSMELTEFAGFPRELVAFYRDLAENNDREWFNERKDSYKANVLAPAQQFVMALGERLRILVPRIVADPAASGRGSIFRIYRDTRFSKDKSPFKTYLGIFFWEGPGKKMENPGFYFHLEPPKLLLATGIHVFPRPVLKAYREAVVDPELGAALVSAIDQVRSSGPYRVGEQHYKKVPRGYDASHPNAEYLLFNGLTASVEGDIPNELYSAAILDYCFDRFEDLLPLHRWLIQLMQRI